MSEGLRSVEGEPRARQPERRFSIAGEAWTVWEDLRLPLDPSLVFENTRLARRVREYPANWLELSDEELYALSWSR